MSRARIVLIALGLAAAAAWALAGFPRQAPPETPLHDEIDDASREELERVLRESREEP